LGRSGDSTQSLDVRLKRLAEQIGALPKKDEILRRHTDEILTLRRVAAAELWAVCAAFVHAINELLHENAVGLDPDTFGADAFHEAGLNLIQINASGRILQVEFQGTPELISTEDFRIPYTLEGSVRIFNQTLLDKDLIEEQLLFYTLERDTNMWRFFDPRTYRSGPFGQSYLISLMEEIV
jgi:hypothetical protein